MTKLTKILLLALILVAVIVLPASATTVTYPEKYYDLQNQENQKIQDHWWAGYAASSDLYIMLMEMQRQTILLEKQNELLSEQNALLANQSLVGHKFTCTHYSGSSCWEWTAT